MVRRNRFRPLLITLMVLAIVSTGIAYAGKSQINTNWRGLAIKGYDPVAYFTMGKPVEGSGDFEYD
jgi:hypothetical protein